MWTDGGLCQTELPLLIWGEHYVGTGTFHLAISRRNTRIVSSNEKSNQISRNLWKSPEIEGNDEKLGSQDW